MNYRSSMQITEKLFAGYRIGRFKESVLEYPVGTTVYFGLKGVCINKGSRG
jgi:hypothetical protein